MLLLATLEALLVAPLGVTLNWASESEHVPPLLRSLADHPWPTASGIVAAFAVITISRHYLAQARAERSLDAGEEGYRRDVFEQVQDQVEDLLHQPLREVGRIELELVARPDAVTDRWKSFYEWLAEAPRSPIGELFQRPSRGLLILGPPGGGKTTLLAQLARDLLKKVKTDPATQLPLATERIPVVVNLASWVVERKTLAEWLVDELAERYRLPPDLGRRWLARNALLLLLDGLDEISGASGGKAIVAANVFLREHNGLLAICCRSDNYEALRTRLDLQAAIEIRPLTPRQVEAYLERAGVSLEKLRTALVPSAPSWLLLLAALFFPGPSSDEPADDDPIVQLLRSPLMLQVIVLVHREKVEMLQPTNGTIEERRAYLFDAYVDAMLARERVHLGGAPQERAPQYTKEQMRHGLHQLACYMREHRQTQVRLNRLERSWLRTVAQQREARLAARLVAGIVLGLAFALPAALAGGTTMGLVLGLLVGGYGALTVAAFDEDDELSPMERALHSASPGEVVGLMLAARYVQIYEDIETAWYYGVAGGLAAVLAFGRAFGLLIGTAAGVAAGLTSATVGLFALAPLLRLAASRVHSTKWRSWRTAVFGLLYGSATGSAIGLAAGLAVDSSVGRIDGQGLRAAVGLPTGVLFGLLFGLFNGLLLGFSGGGAAALRRIVARAFSRQHTRFLDYAADRALLRRVGDAYEFIHPFLLEHFATSSASRRSPR